MKMSSAWARHVVNGLALLTGAATFTYEITDDRKKAWAAKAQTTSYHTSTPWDYNWDKREPESLIKPTADENQSKECLAKVKSRVNRNIFLIRHGQYNLDGSTDEERYLTPLGREQAEATGQRLHELGFPYDFIVRSTMTRAIETGKIISKHLNNVPIRNCDMIREGAPIPPEPPVGHWRPEAKFFEDGARIEAAFRRYFHRALPEQEKDSYEIYVCHANVIRYLVCRAMQFPPEAWLRFSLHHCSITWLTIRPSGRVILRTLGDTGHISADKMTTS